MKDCETIQVFLSCCVSPQEVPTFRNWSFIFLHELPGGFHITGAQYSAIILPSSCIMSSYIGLIKCSFFNKVIVSQIVCFPQPESRKAGGSCWRPHGWCPLLVLHWTSIFCCQTCPMEASGENHVKMWDAGASLPPLQETRVFVGILEYLSAGWFCSLLKWQESRSWGAYFTAFLTDCVTLGKSLSLSGSKLVPL